MLFGFMRRYADYAWLEWCGSPTPVSLRLCRSVAGVDLISPGIPPAGSGGTALRSGDDSLKKPTTPSATKPTAKVQNKDRDMGAALRTVYQKTVEESIPSEMLDLLGKLD